MPFWKKDKSSVPDGSFSVSLDQLDSILTILRYWYGIEVDHWINSEASRYAVIMKISNFRNKSDMKRLSDYFKEAVKQAINLKGSDDPIELMDYYGTFSDFLGVQVSEMEGIAGDKKGDILDVRRLVPTCKIHYPIKNWFFFTDEKRYYDCIIKITLAFESFGEGGSKNAVTLTTKIKGEEELFITEFQSTYKNFGNQVHFLKQGLEVLEEIDARIAEKYATGKRPPRFSPRVPEWYVFECQSEEEAILFNGINETLGIETAYKGKKIEFKMEEFDIPGLISYVRAGLPHYIFRT